MGELDRVVSGIVALFYPHVEAVLHDVKNDRIAKLWNAYSKRSVGEETLLDAESIVGAQLDAVMGPFERTLIDGRRVSCVSIPLQGGRYLLCINFDLTVLNDAIGVLQRFATPLKVQPPALAAGDWHGQMNQVIEDWCRANERHRTALDRQERLQIIAELDERGLFSMRKSADYVARALQVSRSSIYQSLSEIRGSGRIAK